MFHGAKPDIFALAYKLRNNMTEAEKMLWNRLNKNQLKGYRFKPQHPIDIFIADFYCHKKKLVIEVDGEYHKFNLKNDKARTNELISKGLTVIRFSNEQVINQIDSVINEILNYLD